MEKALLLFSPGDLLDAEAARRSYLRIPEVTVPLNHAQRFLDKFSSQKVDLINYMGSDDEDFHRAPALKSLCVALVQLGLYERLMKKTSARADWVLGGKSPDCPLPLVLGEISLSEFLWGSSALQAYDAQDEGLPKSTQRVMKEYQVYERSWATSESFEFKAWGGAHADYWGLVRKSLSELDIQKVVTLGSSQGFPVDLLRERQLRGFDLLESVELDPHLSWFWTGSREVLST